MSFIININNIKVYPISVCNICLQENKKTTKCTNCEFFICNKCLKKWNKYNKTCPQCKNESTYIKNNICNKINKRFNKIKIYLKNLFPFINKIITSLTNYIIINLCSESNIDIFRKTTFCFGMSILILLYASLYSIFYLILIFLASIIIILIIYFFTCCCCCQPIYILFPF